MRRECAGARPNTCLGNRRIGDRHGHTLIFRQIRSNDRRRGNRSHRTGLLDLAPSRFLSARHFVHTTVIYHLGKSFIKGYAHLVTLVQTERRRFYLTAVERDAVTGLRRILGSEDQVVEGIIGTGHVVHHHSVQIAICIGIHRSFRISHLRDQLRNGNGRSLTRIGRHDTAARQVDFLAAVAGHQSNIIQTEFRRNICFELDIKRRSRILERKVLGSEYPIRIFLVTVVHLVRQRSIVRSVRTERNHEVILLETVVIIVLIVILSAESQLQVGLAGGERYVFNRKGCRSRTEEDHVRTRSTVISTRAALAGRTNRGVRTLVRNLRSTLTGGVPTRVSRNQRLIINGFVTRRLVENNRRRHYFALKHIDILLNQCAVGVVNLESHFGRLTDVRSGHRNGHGSIALAFGSRKAHPSLFVLDDSTPGTVRFNDKSTVVLICGLSLRIERQVLRRDVQIGSAHVVIVVGTSREHRHGEHGQCTEEQFPNATLFHKQLNFRVI